MDNNKVYDASLDAEMEDRSHIETIRDNSNSMQIGDKTVGKITGYKFKILIKDKEPLIGEFTREEMDLIYRLYSAEGSSLTQRTVSRYFPNYTFQDFKRILRAFSITKASSPVAPHLLEEKSTEDLIQLTLQGKENDYLRKLEQDRNRLTEVRLKEMTGKYYDLKQQVANFNDFVSGIRFDYKVIPVKSNYTNDITDVVYVSDMHIGADVSKYSIYDNTFNLEVAKQRAGLIFNRILDHNKLTNSTNVVICNLGDSLDGYNGETTRGGHLLPQNMNNKDQYKNYLQVMIELFTNLTICGKFNTIKYVCVESGNHDGDFGWLANKSLEGCLSVLYPEISVQIFERFMDYFTVGEHTFVLCHGKDQKDMFKNLPLTLNEKTESQINEYLEYNNITGGQSRVHFIKGDLHQSATTYGKKFKYKAVASFFGSSEWIHKNFGNTCAAVDFDIVCGDMVLQDRLILN